MQCFKSVGSAQKLPSAHVAVFNTFDVQRRHHGSDRRVGSRSWMRPDRRRFCPEEMAGGCLNRLVAPRSCRGSRRDRRLNASAIVTLREKREMADLQVSGLRDEVLRRKVEWIHLPSRDFGLPSARLEAEWSAQSDRMRAIMRSGENIVVHCKGGLAAPE